MFHNHTLSRRKRRIEFIIYIYKKKFPQVNARFYNSMRSLSFRPTCSFIARILFSRRKTLVLYLGVNQKCRGIYVYPEIRIISFVELYPARVGERQELETLRCTRVLFRRKGAGNHSSFLPAHRPSPSVPPSSPSCFLFLLLGASNSRRIGISSREDISLLRDVSQLSAMHAVVILSSMRERGGSYARKLSFPTLFPPLVVNRSRIENVHVFIASPLDYRVYKEANIFFRILWEIDIILQWSRVANLECFQYVKISIINKWFIHFFLNVIILIDKER